MDEVNVAVIAPILGRDLSFVSDVDPRVRVFDANFAAPGHRAGLIPPAEPAPPSARKNYYPERSWVRAPMPGLRRARHRVAAPQPPMADMGRSGWRKDGSFMP